MRPYIPYEAFDWLQDWIKPDMRVFEYGSGLSTLWLAQHAAEVITVENDAGWFNNIKGKLTPHGINNVTYLHRPEGAAYSKQIHEHEGVFDLVFLDGRFRRECMEQCYSKVKQALLFANSDAPHYLDAYEVMKTFKNGDITDFYSFGLNPYTGEDLPDKWQASIFIKQVLPND